MSFRSSFSVTPAQELLLGLGGAAETLRRGRQSCDSQVSSVPRLRLLPDIMEAWKYHRSGQTSLTQDKSSLNVPYYTHCMCDVYVIHLLRKASVCVCGVRACVTNVPPAL